MNLVDRCSLAIVLPNGYRQFIIDDNPTEIFPFVVSIFIAVVYSFGLNFLASRIFQKVEI